MPYLVVVAITSSSVLMLGYMTRYERGHRPALVLICGRCLPPSWKDLPNGVRFSPIVIQGAPDDHGMWRVHVHTSLLYIVQSSILSWRTLCPKSQSYKLLFEDIYLATCTIWIMGLVRNCFYLYISLFDLLMLLAYIMYNHK